MADVYAIENIVTNGVYIGSSVCYLNRWKQHRRSLRIGKHHSAHLQSAWNKYGEDNFILHLLEKVDKDYMLSVEQGYLDFRKDNYKASLNYNILWTAGNCSGRVFTAASRKKMSDSHKGMKPSQAQLEQQLASWDKKSKDKVLVDPEGQLHTVRLVRPFARKHGLDACQLGNLLRGNVRHHKGWTRVDSAHYILVSPTGVEYRVLILKYFCKEHNLNYKSMHRLASGKRNTCRGWTCKQPMKYRAAVTNG